MEVEGLCWFKKTLFNWQADMAPVIINLNAVYKKYGQSNLAKAARNDSRSWTDVTNRLTDRLTDRHEPRTSVTIVYISCIRCSLKTCWHLLQRDFMRRPHNRSAEVWHALSRDLTVLSAHPRVYPRTEWTMLLPSQSKLVLILSTPEGWKAELTYIPGWFTRPKTVTHPGTNRARCRLTL